MDTSRRQHGWIRAVTVLVCLFAFWAFLHLPEMFYETKGAMFPSYMGDEQSPVNGALHMLEDKSLLGLRNHETLYYGPMFSVIALPAIVADYIFLFATGAVHNASEYKDFLLWDWGGILWKARFTAVLLSFFGLLFFYLFLNTKTINPSRNRLLPLIGTLVFSANFYFFEYAAFFRHWIFMISIFCAQLYFLVKIVEDDKNKKKYLMTQAALSLVIFGINYVWITLQLIWLPVLVKWLKEKQYLSLYQFVIYTVSLLLGAVLIVWWHPFAFFREFGFAQTGVMSVVPETGPKLFSYLYYAQTLLNDLFPLLPIWAVMVGYLMYTKKAYRLYWFWIPIITGFFYYIYFGYFAHHETRYVLPMIAAFFVSFFSLLVYYSEDLFSKRIWKTTIIVVLILTAAYHLMSIFLVSERFLRGPEEQTLIASLIEKQKENKSFSVLIVGEDLLNTPHTKEAYRDYVQKCAKQNVRVYKEIIASQLPETVTPLNVYYYCNAGNPTKEERGKYDTIVYVLRPPDVDYSDFDLSPISPLWFLKNSLTRYIFVAGKEAVAR